MAARSDEFEIVAVNDLGDPKSLATLLKYDSVHGRFKGDVSAEGDCLIVNGNKVKVVAERDPAKLPWKDLGVEIVIESTGLFTEDKKAEGHIAAGAKKVLISAPGKGDKVKTVVLGVNEKSLTKADAIVSNASCTTNCLAPITKVVLDNFGILEGLMTTVHS